MPVYHYRCRECETDFDARQSFSDDPITDCPNCSAEDTVYRVIQPAGVVFKGSGFYITDTKASRDSLTGSTNGNGNGNGIEKTNGNGKKDASIPSSDKSTPAVTPPTKASDGASASTSPAS